MTVAQYPVRDLMHLRMCNVLQLSEDSPALCVSLVLKFVLVASGAFIYEEEQLLEGL